MRVSPPRAILPAAAALLIVAAGCGTEVRREPAARAAGTGAPRIDAGEGVTVRRPRGWHLIAPPIAGLAYPAERLLLTSYPTRRGGACSPERAQRDLPADGALIYLFEYRPPRGAVWEHLRPGRFPPRPRRFRLPRRGPGALECWRVPSHVITFRAAGRPFQVHVAFGARATRARRAQALRILDSLRFAALPPPPPDPYAGWRLLTTETGDSLRTPPRWPAAATTSPRRHPRPRTLFFASNRGLPGLAPAPPHRTGASRRLPARIPGRALDALGEAGVLLWVREERKGPATAGFPALPARAWPQAGDFRPARGGEAARRPCLRWERAAAAAAGHRFSVWIGSGPAASDGDRALARQAAAALALSTGAYRDTPCRRACRTG